MRHGVAMPISSRTIPLYPTAGPRVHASTGSRSRSGRVRVGGEKGKGRRDEVLRSRLNFRSQSYPRVPRPYSQDRDSAPSPAATPIQRHGGGPCMAAAAHEGEGRRASIGRASQTCAAEQHQQEEEEEKRCTYWLTAASRL